MQKRKNIQLLVILTTLIMVIVGMDLFTPDKRGLGIDKRIFTLDPQTVITDVSIKRNDNSLQNDFSFVRGAWIVNNRYKMDASMRDVFFSVLSQMEIRRPISKENEQGLVELLDKSGFEVTISNNGEQVKSYTVGGIDDQMETYTIDEYGSVYEMHIPGYQSYIAGIFGVPENDWRNRFVFNINPVSLSNLEIKLGDSQYKITYDNNRFTLENGLADSTTLANHVESIVFLQADSFVDKEERPELVNYIETSTPELVIVVNDITGNAEQLKLYPKREDTPFIAGVTEDGSVALFNAKRIKNIYREKDDF